MSMSKTTNTYNRQNWENSDFPILCQTCLGDNPYVRMIKERYGKECKICTRPFTTFRWCPGARMRFKKTEICQTCSRLKNVCQTCVLDLEYGLPIQVRDAALQIVDKIPESNVNKEFYIQNVDSEVADTDGTQPAGIVGKSLSASAVLSKLARTTPYYKRNLPHICSFWVKGECTRGEECPYRHAKPNDPEDPLNEQNIKDRYYGRNDPVAEKIMKKSEKMPRLEPPEDKTITTLYVGNLSENITEPDIRDNFYQYGEIRSIKLIPRQQCAFVQYTKRAAAEFAAEKTFNNVILHDRKLTIKWSHSQAKDNIMGKTDRRFELHAIPPQQQPTIQRTNANDFFNLQSQAMILPPGMKLHQIPQGLLPKDAYNTIYAAGDYTAPYAIPDQTAASVQGPPPPMGSVPTSTFIPSNLQIPLPGIIPPSTQYPSQNPGYSGTSNKS